VRTHGLRIDVNCSILFTEMLLVERRPCDPAASASSFGWRLAHAV
jgi:hypothetical protein